MFVIFKCCSHFGATWSNSLLNASVVHCCVKCWRACATWRTYRARFNTNVRTLSCHTLAGMESARELGWCKHIKWIYRTNITSMLTAYHIRINIFFFVASCPFDCYCVYSVSYRVHICRIVFVSIQWVHVQVHTMCFFRWVWPSCFGHSLKILRFG